MLIRQELQIPSFHHDLNLTKITRSSVKGHVTIYRVAFLTRICDKCLYMKVLEIYQTFWFYQLLQMLIHTELRIPSFHHDLSLTKITRSPFKGHFAIYWVAFLTWICDKCLYMKVLEIYQTFWFYQLLQMLIHTELRIPSFHHDLSLTKITRSSVKGHVTIYRVAFSTWICDKCLYMKVLEIYQTFWFYQLLQMLIHTELRIPSFHHDLSLTKITRSPVKGHFAIYRVAFLTWIYDKWL